MTTYLFMLAPELGEAMGQRMLAELCAHFPQHDFEYAEAKEDDLENSILPIFAVDDVNDLPATDEMEMIQEAFGRLLADAKN